MSKGRERNLLLMKFVAGKAVRTCLLFSLCKNGATELDFTASGIDLKTQPCLLVSLNKKSVDKVEEFIEEILIPYWLEASFVTKVCNLDLQEASTQRLEVCVCGRAPCCPFLDVPSKRTFFF